MKTVFPLFLILFLSCSSETISTVRKGSEPAMSAKTNELIRLIRPIIESAAAIEKEFNLAMWKAWTTGKKEFYDAYPRLEMKLRSVYSDPGKFSDLKKYREAKGALDPILQREVEILYLYFLENQVDKALLEKIVAKGAEVDEKFNRYRGKIHGIEVTSNQIKEILRRSTDRHEREEAWLAQKGVGKVIEKDIIELIKLRNEAALSLGFANFYEMKLALGELTPAEVKGLFDRLVTETEEAYRKAKSEIDTLLAKRLNIRPEELMPWDYSDPFFQEAPDLSEGGGKDELFKDSDLLKISLKFFDGLGLDARDILERSSLYEQPDKSPHAFSFSIDRANDIRILTNLKNDEYWMSTLIHELGHALYDKYVDKSLPWLLRQPAHSFTTEGIAQMFERSVKKRTFLLEIAGLPEEKFSKLLPVYEKELHYRQLIFSRWSAVMVNFEMEAYKNPDQDLNKLWWDLVEKYQHLKKPKGRNEPDWASKIHIASAPVYYHNYIMGEMFASQLLAAIAVENLKKNGAASVSALKDVPVEEIRKIDFVNMPWVGEYLKEKVFKPGASKDWREFVKSATGEYLSAEHYARQFVK